MSPIFSDIVRSTVRTVTPWLVGLVVTGLARFGFAWEPSPEIFISVSTLLSTVFYAVARLLEEKYSAKWGWLLGVAGAPVYEIPFGDEYISRHGAGEEDPDDMPVAYTA